MFHDNIQFVFMASYQISTIAFQSDYFDKICSISLIRVPLQKTSIFFVSRQNNPIPTVSQFNSNKK